MKLHANPCFNYVDTKRSQYNNGIKPYKDNQTD